MEKREALKGGLIQEEEKRALKGEMWGSASAHFTGIWKAGGIEGAPHGQCCPGHSGSRRRCERSQALKEPLIPIWGFRFTPTRFS